MCHAQILLCVDSPNKKYICPNQVIRPCSCYVCLSWDRPKLGNPFHILRCGQFVVVSPNILPNVQNNEGLLPDRTRSGSLHLGVMVFEVIPNIMLLVRRTCRLLG